MATRSPGPCSLAVLLCVSSPALAQADFELPEGLEATLWAESPELFNPTAIDVDERGRVWVSEAVNYRRWRGRNPGREHPKGERIVILEDSDADGRCDRSTVFAQELDLLSPLGICVVPYGPDGRGGREVYVSASPNIYRYRDVDGDDVPEEREVFLSGFGGPDHDHGVHSLVLGADGFLYGAVGNAGPHVVTDRSGWTLRSGSLYRGGGEFVADNKPGLRSDDGRIWTGGLMFRVRPSGERLEVLAHNFRNPYELAIDAFGNLYTADNDDDGNASCRTLWVLEGGDYGYLSKDGTRTWQADRRPDQEIQDAHWHADDPGVAPPGTINGAGGPTGVAVYEADLLEDWIGGALLNADAGAGVVYVHRPRVQGAGRILEPAAPLIRGRGDDPSAAWFRPSDVAVGMDGEVFVADWYDPGVGGHAMGDREAYGRILRVAPKGFVPRPEERGQGLEASAVNVRHQAWSRASELGEMEAGDTADPAVRAARVRLLPPSLPEVRRALGDPSPIVRRAAAVRLARSDALDEEALVEFARILDPSDRYELEAWGLMVDAFLAQGGDRSIWSRIDTGLLANPPDAEASKREARRRALAWRMHPPEALPLFVAEAQIESSPLATRRRMVDAIAFLPTEEAAGAMAALALTGPKELRSLAAAWCRQRSTNDWRAFELAAELASNGLEDAERVLQTGVVRQGSLPIDVELADARVLWLVARDGADGNGCDWADWLEPRFVTPEGEVSLLELEWIAAEAQWGEVRRGKNAAGGALLVDGEAVNGIGTHAESRIAFGVPQGATRFLARAAVDDGGTQQAGAPTSVVFEVHLERAPAQDRIAALEAELDSTANPAARRAAASALARDPEGGMRVVQLAERGELDPDLRAALLAGLRDNPDLAVQALAAQAFPALRGAAKLSPEELLAIQGDARRGEQVFFDPRSSCSTCHSMVRGRSRRGGDVGPELTHVRGKLAPSEILNAILEPSQEIAFGFDTWMIEDRSGRLLVGFLLADGEELLLKDTQGRRHALRADEVTERYRQEISVMPEGLALGLSAQDVADLVAFLGEDPEREPRLGPPIALFDGKSLAGWRAHLAEPSVAMDEVWSVRDGVLVCRGQPMGYLSTLESYESFVLTLDWRFDPASGPGNSGVLLRMNGPDQVWPRSIEAQLQHQNAGDIWNIENMFLSTDPERTSGRHASRSHLTNERPLGEWNRYVVTLDRGHLTLEVNGLVQNEARWCEVLSGPIGLQSEGAQIHLRSIELRPILN